MELSIRLPTRGLKRCLAMAVVCAPFAGSFYSVPGLSARHSHGLCTTRMMGGARAATHTSCAATLCSLEEEAALEEKGAGILPPWELIPFSEKFDHLQGELTRPDFADQAWENSQEHLRSIVVELARCVLPFSEHPYLPLQHAAALLLVGRLSERAKGARAEEEGVPAGMFSSLKYSTKKNGVARAAADVAQGSIPKFDSSYERQAVIRGVERCLAEFGLVWSTARLLEACAPPETKQDFLFHLRPILEHAPARDRHEAVLVLCRGLFTPGHNKEPSRVHDNVHGCALRGEHGGYPLEEVFAEVQRGTVDVPAGLRAARKAFPFLEMLSRWAWRCKISAEEEATAGKRRKSVTKSFGKKSKRKRETEEAAAVATAPAAAAAQAGGEAGGASQDRKARELSGEEAAAGVGGGKERSREDTGVAKLLVELAKADPSGDTIRSMQRWACEAILPEEMGEAASEAPADRNEIARGIVCTHEIFVSGQKVHRQRWARSCREVGEVIRLLVWAMDQENLQGKDVKSMVNHGLFVTAFLRSLPLGVKARKGYELLVSGGRTPGAVKGLELKQVPTRVSSWEEAVKVLDSGLASVLQVSQKTAHGDAFGIALSELLTTWRSPYALADYYVMHRKNAEVLRVYVRFLLALLGLSDETVRDIRIKDASNFAHMKHFPGAVRQRWEAEPGTLKGTMDPQVIFRMGDDTRSCMGIRRSCSAQNRALLGYLVQGNVRLVGVQSESGRMEARAVLRLLLRHDNMAPVLFMDSVYYASNPDSSLEDQVVAEAQSVSTAVGVPLYRAGDKIPRAEPTEEDKEKLAQEREAAAAAATTTLAEEALRANEDYDEMQDRAFEVGVAEYRSSSSSSSGDDIWGDNEEGYGGEGGFSVGEGVLFQAGVAQYGEEPAPPEDEGTPEMCELVEMDGLSPWVYSDGAVGDATNPGVMQRDLSHAGSARRIVLAQLEYEPQQEEEEEEEEAKARA
eukprot:g12496.t1